MDSKRNDGVIAVGLLCVEAGLFGFGHAMSVSPEVSSGNGNPAILLAMLLIFLFVTSVRSVIRFLHRLQVRPPGLTILLLLSGSSVLFGSIYQIHHYRTYRADLIDHLMHREGATRDLEYIRSITSVFDIHMNDQTFNSTTFFIFTCAILLVSSSFLLLHHWWLNVPR
ncbi:MULTISPECIES: hypothetical protein [unclassified Exiguobacterium]|uniref:hypothetical protein n=1 Tax=unclassified Exiguobacterium TaxID=2644629 RepID=UPI000B595245|nr:MULTISPECIES: hypothetical protein [unclassified Exiguobacterium]ASI34198.1 hypothetical protein A0126_00920 [Exiguobacterium sp. N4-1P]